MSSESLKDKIPPHSQEAEQACLGALLLDPDSLAAVVRYIRPEDFYLPAHNQIFAAVIALHEKGQKADIITITEEMRLAGSLDRAGGPGYIASLTSMTPSSANVEYYARIIQEMSTRRSLIRLASEVSFLAFDDTSETGPILDQIQSKIFEITQNRRTASYHSIKELIPDTITLIEQLSNNPNAFTGIPSGLTDLDAMTSGFQNSEFIVIGARPSVGKTALALSFTAHIAIDCKIPAAFFSLEMSERALMNRIISSEALVPGERIRTGRLRSSDLNDLMDAAGRIYEAPLYIVDMPNMKLLELRTMARRLVLERGVKIIFVDYITLITHENAELPRWEQISAISRSLKSLARELDIPIVALSQLKREAEGKQPNLADVRESGSIEQDADLILFLHRDREINKTQDQRSEQIETELIVAKQRNGPIGKTNVWFKPSYAKFVNMEHYQR
ncbi:MAG: replicative DNA helicase [Spirochaetia bacterium]|jgi:replicative DNA helicase|nr:replicative DNA helicase [Spirochaetia bacterium]